MEGDFIKLPASTLQELRKKRPKSVKANPEKEVLRRSQHARSVAVLGAEDETVRFLEDLVFGSEDTLFQSLGQNQEKVEPEAALGLDESSEDEKSCDGDEQQPPIKRAAWIDEDDETEEQVDLTHRFRRDFVKGGESSLSKSGLQERMRESFQRAMGGTPAWAQTDPTQPRKKPVEDSGSEDDDLTRKTGTFTRTSENLPKGILKMKKCLDCNASRGSSDSITSVQFHPNAQVVMTTGLDQSLSLFQVDGQSNPLVQSIFLEKFPVGKARFTADGLTVMATSFRNKLFYLYHMMEGKVTPVSGVRGLSEARVKEFSMCPEGDAVLLWGTRGYLHLLQLKTNEVVRSLKLNGEVSAVSFSSDGQKVFSSSDEGEVFVWDLRSSRCLNRFTDDGCVKSTSMSASPNGRYLACGSQSGVVNIYSLDSCLSSSCPKPIKSVMNLTTTATSLRFNPTSELLALGSRAEDEAVKLLHMPSLTVFSNFPVSKRKICHRVQDMAFSPHSGFFCLATNKGRVPLYRLLHYKDF
ncbi:U3 small nucleolar RNA-associated protein 18 homolog [Eucyclogobius newberryi]|uniref:U3 small nucleolar RNA-associated protein 18 homolog n=1 Tax=Eucyclogobius newberryi TaxID=166745 RepID=UPI003B598D03